MYKLAVESLITLPKTTRNLGDRLSTSLAVSRESNRHCLMMVLNGVRFLARPGCALRGDKDENFESTHEIDGK